MNQSDTSSLVYIMTNLMSGKIKPRKLKDTRGFSSISQNNGKLPMKKTQKMIHKN